MSEGQVYTAAKSDALFEKRSIIRYTKHGARKSATAPKRVFVPFRGFDGQALAGTGALVFEGELLDLKP